MVTVPDPDEQDGREPRRRDRSADTDATFAAIVADWRTEPDAPRWPAEAEHAEQGRGGDDQDVASAPQVERDAQDDNAPSNAPDREDEHYQPPEPPPFPVPQPRTIGGVLLVALGVLLLIQPDLLSISSTYGTPLGLLAVTAGIGWLVLGLRGGPPSEGWDDGARL